MEYIDISLPIHNHSLTLPHEPAPQITQGVYGVSQITFNSHTGTHLDAPRLLDPQGTSIDQLDLSKLQGPVTFINIPSSAPQITPQELMRKPILPGSRVIFKTKNSTLLQKTQYDPSYTYISPQAGQFLADRQVNLVGFDYLSVDNPKFPQLPVHTLLLSRQIPILEGIYLEHVPPGEYQLTVFPINIFQAGAAPCRAFLTKK